MQIVGTCSENMDLACCVTSGRGGARLFRRVAAAGWHAHARIEFFPGADHVAG